MKLKTIKKTIHIHAPKEKIWEVLFDDKYTRIWYAAFSEGAYAITDWQLGSKAIFTDPGNSGLVARIIENVPNEALTLEFTGNFADGVEDCDSDIAKLVIGGHESYKVSEVNGITHLDTAADMGEDFFESMSLASDNAFQMVKIISEIIATDGNTENTAEPGRLYITHEINAPVEKVFIAWTDEKQLATWWGPDGFTNPVCELDANPGGNINIDMTGPDGTVYPMGGTVLEVEALSKLVFTTTAFEDERGTAGLADLNTVKFEESNGKTVIHLKVDVIKATRETQSSLDGMEEGWKQSFVRLQNHLNQN